ncbi:MAG: response regulator transcription factor [Polyangia bacterium]|jgi:DNA-binding response OmpR family regulator
MPETILLVEDDPSILRGLQMNLGLEGFRVVTARDGAEGLKLARQHRPDLIVLDVMLPKLTGLEVIRALRTEDPDTPIVVLSAKDQEGDKVLALSLGADDYVTKPFGIAELLARIRAALRRQRRREVGTAQRTFGDVTVDLDGRRILIGGESVETTAREFDLLRFFLAHPNVAFSREQLMHQVWGPDHYGTVRTVDNFVARLRAKIGDDPVEPRHIETVRGVGYRFNP